MTSSPANRRVPTGAQASHPPAPGVLAIYRNRLHDFALLTTELSAGQASPSALKCGAYGSAIRGGSRTHASPIVYSYFIGREKSSVDLMPIFLHDVFEMMILRRLR